MAIASDRVGVNAAPIATVGAENAPPAITDFMAAFRSGFLTVDDLVRRGAALPAAVAGSQQDLRDRVQLRPLAREQQMGALSADIQLQPKRTANLSAAEDLKSLLMSEQGRKLPTPEEIQSDEATRLKKAQLANALASDDQNVRGKALATASQEDILDVWTVAFGQEPPESIQVPGGGAEPKPMEMWVTENYGPNALAGDAQAVLNRPDVKQGYAAYAAEARNRPLTYFRGSPEYIQKLKDDVLKADLSIGLQKATVAAAPGILAAQAKAKAEAPALEAKRQTDALNDVLAELHRSEPLKRFEPQFEAFAKVDEVRNSGRKITNADDMTLLYSLVKVLDPTSAVREGENKLALSTNPTIIQIYNQIRGTVFNTNKLFGEQARLDLFNAMDSLKAAAIETVVPEIKRISGIADSKSVPVDMVFTGPYQDLLKAAKDATVAPAAAATPSAERTATNRATGQRMVYRNGQWQPL